MSSERVQVYHYPLSAPSRAVRVFVEATNLPHDLHSISVVAGETHSPEYLKVNPIGTVPFVKIGGFGLSDSGAILGYLADRFEVQDHWYPKNLEARARVNAVMLWHGSTLRTGSNQLMNYRVFVPVIAGGPENEDIVQGLLLPTLHKALKDINETFLKDSYFVAGDEISIADLLLAFEVEQLRFQDASGKEPDFQQLLAQYANVRPWLERVAVGCAPYYEHALQAVKIAAEEFVKKLKDPSYAPNIPKAEAAAA